MPVDFATVRANAETDGIPVSEIAVIYRDLLPDERLCLKQSGLVVYETEGTVIARMAADGNQMFSEKAVSVHSLSA